MWRLIRGLGFAYSYNMIPRPNEGLLHLTFFKATNVIGAYNKTKAILVSQLELYRYKLISNTTFDCSFTICKGQR